LRRAKRIRYLIAVLALSLAPTALSGDITKPASSTAPGESKIAFKQTDSGAATVGRVIGGFVLVVLIGYGALYGIRRYFPSVIGQSAVGERKINVLETRRLTPKSTLFLVEIDGQRLLLGQSGDRLENLHRFEKMQSRSDQDDAG
jgi:flagellar biogenesis protein FliO